MKLSLSFVLCSVLIYCMISCPSVSASDESKSDETEEDSNETFRKCAGLYLKSKGKLDIEVPSGKKSSFCLFGINFALRAMRDIMEIGAKKEMPDKATCIMDELDKNDVLDFILEMGYVQDNEKIPEDERKVSTSAMEAIGDKKLKAIGTACEIDVEKLENLMMTVTQYSFDSSEEKDDDSSVKTETDA